MNLDRRRSLRIPVDLTVQWRRGWRHAVSKVHDINANGLFLMTDEVVPVNQLMELIVALPRGPLSFLAVSRFCGKAKWGNGIGVEIHVIAPAERDEWLRFYRERLARAVRSLPAGVVDRIAG